MKIECVEGGRLASRRRRALVWGSAAALGAVALGRSPARAADDDTLDAFVTARMSRAHIPGIAAVLIRDGRIVGTPSWGQARIESPSIAMSADAVMNIASISKTVTLTALLQLVDEERVDLDVDVSTYLPFRLRHPLHGDVPITLRQLATHRAGVADGRAYARGYACGDAAIALARWLERYFARDGGGDQFHPWAPGEREAYCNVGFGVIALAVERVAGEPFAARCRRRIFEPAGMARSTWFIAETDPRWPAVTPYTWVERGRARSPRWGGENQGAIQPAGPNTGEGLDGVWLPNCLYGHPNWPDGWLRSSVRDIAAYLLAHARGGHEGRPRFFGEALRRRVDVDELLWETHALPDGSSAWGAAGHDPGVNTAMFHRDADRTGVVVFMNTYLGREQPVSDEIVARLFVAAAHAA